MTIQGVHPAIYFILHTALAEFTPAHTAGPLTEITSSSMVFLSLPSFPRTGRLNTLSGEWRIASVALDYWNEHQPASDCDTLELVLQVALKVF